MKRYDAKENPPTNMEEVLVADGFGGVATAWYSPIDGKWFASELFLEAENYDGWATITLNDDVKYWMPIPKELLEED